MVSNQRYSTARFYISSGTGNSLRVAKWMGEVARIQGIDARYTFIDKRLIKIEKPDSDSLVGVFMPTHGFTAPWSVIKFAFRMPRTRKTEAVVVATQGRIQFGEKFFIPGLSAFTTFLIALILAIKGYRVRGVQSINMPVNWMALMPGQNKTNVRIMLDKARIPSERFIRKILAGQRSWFTVLNIVIFLLALPLIPVSIGYLIFGKTALAKIFFVNRKCTGCGQCAEICPNAAIKIKGGKHQTPFWTFHCESCMCCMAFCPEEAIEVHQPLVYLVWKVAWLGGFFVVLKYLYSILGFDFQVQNSLIIRIIHYGYYLGVWFLFSVLLFWVSRIPIINRILNYTTLTAIYRRYREPGTTLSDLKGK